MIEVCIKLKTHIYNNDKFTVSSESGNGKLTYPVALITADEATLAGHRKSYLPTNQTWWLMSPSSFSSGFNSTYEFSMRSNGGLLNTIITYTSDVRPSVSLAPKTMINNGNGSQSSPYEIVVQ